MKDLFELWKAARKLPSYVTAKVIHRDGQFLIVMLSQTVEEDDCSWTDVWVENGRIDCFGNWVLGRYVVDKTPIKA